MTEQLPSLPEDAFLVDSLEVLDCWINARMNEMPEWIRAAVKTLQPIERAALRRRHEQPAWAFESAHSRLRLAAIANDKLELSSSLHQELAELDRTLRAAAKTIEDEAVRTQIGAIRMELRRHLAKQIEVRQRVAYGCTRAAI